MRRKKKTQTNYWTREMDDIISQYQQTHDEHIFNTIIYPAIYKMCHDIVYRYHLNEDVQMNFDEAIQTIVTHTASQINSYVQSKKTKSFSYFTRIAVNNLYWHCTKAKERGETFTSLNAMQIGGEIVDHSDNIENPNIYGTSEWIEKEYFEYVKEYWSYNFYHHFPKRFQVAFTARIVLDILFDGSWITSKGLSAKQALFTSIKSKYEKLYQKKPRQQYITMAIRRIKEVNQKLLISFNEGHPIQQFVKLLPAAKQKRWRLANRDKVLEAQRKYNEAHRPERWEYYKKWRARNQDKVKEYNRLAGLRRKNARTTLCGQ